MRAHKELIYFGVAGVIGYLVDVTITIVSQPLLGAYFGRVPAFIAAATATWLFNRTLTFAAKNKVHESLFHEYFRYLGLMVFGLIVNYAVYALSITFLGRHNYAIFISVALGSLAGMSVNYLNSKRFLYKG